MRKKRYTAIFLAALSFAVLAGIAGADERVSGTIKSINLETESLVVTSYEGKDVTITISAEDAQTLRKLKNRQISVDDDVRVKYIRKDGRNVATSLRRTAVCGC